MGKGTAGRPPRNRLRSPMIAPEFVALPAGSFEMGGSRHDKFADPSEHPRHPVTIPEGVSLSRFPVTLADWRSFRGAGPESSLPVTEVTWWDAREYAEWLGTLLARPCRLPTEAEWECAARAGEEHPATPTPNEANFLYDEAGRRTGPGSPTPVGAHGVNAFGFGDLLGNVLEWVADCWHPDYQRAPSDGTAWREDPPAEQRVVRAGGWDAMPRLLRATWRDSRPPASKCDNLGFRVAIGP